MNKAPDLQHLDFYESTLNNLTEGVIWTNSDGQVVYSNDASARWFSLSKKELLQRSIYDLLPASGIGEWLNKLIARPEEIHAPLIVVLNKSMRLSLYAVVSISVGANKYNCFLIKEEGATGNDPNEMLRIISEGTASVIGGDFFKSLAYHVILSTGIRYAIVTECAD